MLRACAYAIPAVAVLVGGLVVAADKKEKPNAPRPLLPHDLARLFTEYDRNHDGFLQREELPEELRANFDKVDVNKDGKISPEELHRGMVYFQRQRRPSDLVFVLVEMSDCDECCAGELQTAYDALRKLDRNHDGKIDAEELRQGREAMIAARVDRILKALDANKDGKISKDEARGMIREHFQQLDRNGDGYVDRQELMRGAAERPKAAAGEKTGQGRSPRRER